MAGSQTCNEITFKAVFSDSFPEGENSTQARKAPRGHGTRSNTGMLVFPPWVFPISTVKTPHGKSQVRRCAQVFPEPLTPRPASPSAFRVHCAKYAAEQRQSGLDWGRGVKRAHNQLPANLPLPCFRLPSLDRKPAIYNYTIACGVSRRRAWQPTLVFLPGEVHAQTEPGGPQSMESRSPRRLSE